MAPSCGHGRRCRHLSGGDFTFGSPESCYPPNVCLEPRHMEMRLTIDIASRTVSGSNAITVVSNSTDAKSIELNAVDFHDVSVDVSCGGSYSYDGSKITVRLNDPLAKGSETIISVNYTVVDPLGGLYFSYPDDDYPTNPTFAASDHETERARYWIPCIDHPHVRTTYHWFLTSSSEYTILANGKRIGEETNQNDGTKTVEWKHDYPCPSYLACIAVGKFVEYVDKPTDAGSGQMIPVAYYTSDTDDHTPADLKRAFGKTPVMIQWLTSKIGTAMPWDKYYQFALREFSGAMENQSLVSWDDFAVLDETLYNEYGHWVDTVNLHEMAHTYFGNMVVMRHFSHAWLKESWAEYMEAVYKEDTLSSDDFQYDMFFYAHRYFREADEDYIRPIVHNTYNTSWDLFDAHLYPGGAWRLHMLRKMIGDGVFWDAVRDYVATFAGKLVETIDFQRTLERHSGMVLDKFFDQWIFTAKGYPHLSVNYSYSAEDSTVKFTIQQKQIKKDGGGDARAAPFEFALDLAWMTEGGSEYEIRRVKIDREEHVFLFGVPSEPAQVRLDPNMKLLFKLEFEPDEKLSVNQLRESPDVIGRIQAAQTLLKTGKPKHYTTVRDQYDTEPYWGVRAEIVKAMSKFNSRFAIPALVHILDAEKEPKLLFRVVNEIGAIRDTKINDALLRFLKRDDVGPLARASCLRALGKQRLESNSDVLVEHTTVPSFHDYVAKGAFDGLAELRDRTTLELLLTRVDRGKTSWRARRNAIAAMAAVAKWLDDKEQQTVKEKLTDLARDPDGRVRMSVASALQTLKAKDCVNVIQSMKPLHVHQEQIILERKIRSLQSLSKDGQQMNDMKKEIEKLNETVSKLEKRIHELEAKSEKI